MIAKRFEAKWGAGYIHTQAREIEATAITYDMGYDPEDIETIDTLEVGQVWIAPSFAEHSVRRVL